MEATMINRMSLLNAYGFKNGVFSADKILDFEFNNKIEVKAGKLLGAADIDRYEEFITSPFGTIS